MQYLIMGFDGKDNEALNRRLTVRQAHIDMGEQLFKSGNMWYGAALRDDDGKMIGSALFMDFDSEKDLQNRLDKEPYVVGKVWEKVEIHKCSTRDPWQYNRPKEWFEERNKK
ncbi:MAG: YciI family protein [Candidatus Gracilibacteria bacterium]|nr:YciI family protein [Candidatus Gracilibacteria bacterium]